MARRFACELPILQFGILGLIAGEGKREASPFMRTSSVRVFTSIRLITHAITERCKFTNDYRSIGRSMRKPVRY